MSRSSSRGARCRVAERYPKLSLTTLSLDFLNMLHLPHTKDLQKTASNTNFHLTRTSQVRYCHVPTTEIWKVLNIRFCPLEVNIVFGSSGSAENLWVPRYCHLPILMFLADAPHANQ